MKRTPQRTQRQTLKAPVYADINYAQMEGFLSGDKEVNDDGNASAAVTALLAMGAAVTVAVIVLATMGFFEPPSSKLVAENEQLKEQLATSQNEAASRAAQVEAIKSCVAGQ